MGEFTIRQANPPALAATRRPRTTPIEQIQWHATRGSTSMDAQVEATEGWFASPQNLAVSGDGSWGGSADFVLGPDRRIGGAIAIVQFGPWGETFSSWSAGYGNAGTLPAAPYAVAIEVAQPAGKDAAGRWTGDPNATYEPFTAETIEACAWLVGHINENLARLGQEPIPAVHIPRWDQATGQPVPRGHIGHDELANGWKLRKSDPGPLFPWDDLMRRLQPAAAPVADPFQAGRLEMYEAWLRDAESYAEHVKSLRDAWAIRAG